VIIFVGVLISFIGMLLIGSNPYLLIPDHIAFMITGICIAGLGGALCNNNGVPAIIKVLERRY
jgi:hypothetical protein